MLKWPKAKSFGQVLDDNKGAGPGFDLLRMGLAIAILLSHSSGITGNRGFLSSVLANLFGLSPEVAGAIGAQAAGPLLGSEGPVVTGLARPYTLSLVPMFFALSGFLVTGSAFRTRSVPRFLGLRALRIVPALFVEVMLCAVVLGAIFTTLPLKEYFSSSGFWIYFGNIIGHVVLTLPGVFETTSMSKNVNSNLWTLPYEFYCYVIIAIGMFASVLYNRMLFTVLFAIATVALLIGNSFFGVHVVGGRLTGATMVYYFFVGVFFFLWRERIAYRWSYAIVAGVICYVLMMSSRTVYLYPILLTYLTVFIGLTSFPRIPYLNSGDYSYGVYLYGYPTTQAIVAAVPALRHNLGAVALLALVLTLLFSVASWHLIEKHFLKLKVYIAPRSAKISAMLHPESLKPDVPIDSQPVSKTAI